MPKKQRHMGYVSVPLLYKVKVMQFKIFFISMINEFDLDSGPAASFSQRENDAVRCKGCRAQHGDLPLTPDVHPEIAHFPWDISHTHPGLKPT